MESAHVGPLGWNCTRFDANLVTALPPQGLAKQWDGLVQGFGALQRASLVHEDERPEGGRLVQVLCAYESGVLPIHVAVDAQLHLVGLRPGKRPERAAVERAARQFVSFAHERKWAEAVKPFDPKMAEALPAEKLAALFQEFDAQTGRLATIMAARITPTP